MFIMKLIKSPRFKENSVICITGASSGIGRELAMQYAVRKCRLFLGARSKDKLEEVAKICRELGSQCDYKVCDVRSETDCKDFVQSCVDRYGEMDIMVLNAGINAHIKFEDMENLALFNEIMKTNFFGYLYCTKYALPHLKKNKGQFIVLSSFSGEIGLPYRSAYCASKFAVTGFFESLRIEMDNHDVAITIICPPSVRTNLRENGLAKVENKGDNVEPDESRMPVEECVKTMLEAADRRARKIFFPTNAYLGVYLRPIFPDFVDNRLKVRASRL